jgi:hypothetical protein
VSKLDAPADLVIVHVILKSYRHREKSSLTPIGLSGKLKVWWHARRAVPMTRTEQVAPIRELPLSRIALVLGLIVLAALLASAFIVGRNGQIAAEAVVRVEIAREDKTLCADLGFADDGKYLRCAGVFAEIRRKQKERWDAAIQ